MNNWYKESKMADKSDSPDSKIHPSCQYYKRWGTTPEGTNMGEDKYIWKKDIELDAGEREEAKVAMKEMLEGDLNSPIGISHGICDYCMDLINQIGIPDTREEINDLIEKSLSM